MLRWIARGGLLVLVLLGLLALASAWLAAPALRAGLRLTGLEDVRVDEVRIGLGRTEIAGLRLGPAPGQEAARVQADYGLGGLLRGRLESLTVLGLRLRGRLTERGIELAGLPTTGRTGDAQLPVPLPQRLVLRDARIELATPFGVLDLPFQASLQPDGRRADFHLAAAPLTLRRAEGSLSGRLELAGSLPIGGNASFPLDGLDARGELQIDGRGLEVPRLAEGIDASGIITLVTTDGRVSLTTEDLKARAERLADLPAMGRALPAPLELRAGSKERPLRLALASEPSGYGLDVDGAMTLIAAGSQLEGQAEASLMLDRSLELRALDRAELSIAAQDLKWQGLEAQDARLELSASGPLAGLRGTGHVEIAGGTGVASGLSLDGLHLEQAFDLARKDERLVLTLKPGGTASLAGLDWQGQLRTGPVSITPRASDDAALLVQTEDGMLRGWEPMLSPASR